VNGRGAVNARGQRTSGFSLVEVLIAMALMVTFTGAVMRLVLSGQTIARVQPEAADQQQRTRVALQSLAQDVARAGSGLDAGPYAGSLQQFFAALTPSGDGGVTIWYVSSRETQATLASGAGAGTGELTLAANRICPAGQSACAFSPASTGILFDAGGCHDVLRIDAAGASALQLRAPPAACTYPPGSAVAQGEVRTYHVNVAARQLLRRDEATGIDLPVLDGVDAMTVDYYDDAASSNPAPIDPVISPRAIRRVRITLRFGANARGAVPDLVVFLDVAPVNLALG
jgi:prepilin-type N-terminal cleavage/methylation domain-containing protein